MNTKDETLLEKFGWIVECYSPMEMRHTETECFVTGNYAVELVLDGYRTCKYDGDLEE